MTLILRYNSWYILIIQKSAINFKICSRGCSKINKTTCWFMGSLYSGISANGDVSKKSIPGECFSFTLLRWVSRRTKNRRGKKKYLFMILTSPHDDMSSFAYFLLARFADPIWFSEDLPAFDWNSFNGTFTMINYCSMGCTYATLEARLASKMTFYQTCWGCKLLNKHFNTK